MLFACRAMLDKAPRIVDHRSIQRVTIPLERLQGYENVTNDEYEKYAKNVKINKSYKEKDDIIIKCQNIKKEGTGVCSNFSILSYVSYGKIQNGEDKCSKLKLSKDEDIFAKGYQDKIKCYMAIELLRSSDLEDQVWMDVISPSESKATTTDITIGKMKSIGDCYKISHRTIAMLGIEDAELLTKIVNMSENIIREYESNEYKAEGRRLGEMLRGFEANDSINTKDERQTKLYEDAKDFIYKVGKMSEYSYWSRIWTLQEQLMSNEIIYCFANYETENADVIVSSGYISKLYDRLTEISNMPFFDFSMFSVSGNLGMANRIAATCLPGLMTYKERLHRTNTLYKGQYKSVEDVMIDTLRFNTRYASEEDSIYQALAVVLQVYDYSVFEGSNRKEDMETVRIRVLSKMATLGYVPIKLIDGCENNSWIPEDVSKREEDVHKQYATSIFYSLIKVDDSVKMVVDNQKALNIKSVVVDVHVKYENFVIKDECNGRQKIETKVRISGKLESKCTVIVNKCDMNENGIKASMVLLGKCNMLFLNNRNIGSIFLNIDNKTIEDEQLSNGHKYVELKYKW